MRVLVDILVLLTAVVLGASGPRMIDFDHDQVGPLPSEWESAMSKTGGTPGTIW